MDAADLERVIVDSVDYEPDSVLIDRDGWVQVRTPSSHRSNHNQVLLAHASPSEVDATIEAVLEEHRGRGANCRWFVGPSSQPPGLADRISAAGWSLLGESIGMTLPVANQGPPLSVRGLTVRAIEADDLELYASLTATAFGQGDAYREAVEYIAAKTLRPSSRPPVLLSIGFIDGEPAATAQLRVLPYGGYLQGAAVLPAYRRRGIYAALVRYRLAALRERGRDTAVIWADPTSSAIACRKLGFREICRGTFFESPVVGGSTSPRRPA